MNNEEFGKVEDLLLSNNEDDVELGNNILVHYFGFTFSDLKAYRFCLSQKYSEWVFANDREGKIRKCKSEGSAE